MQVTTQRSIIKDLPKRWRDTYAPFDNDSFLFASRNGYSDAPTKQEIADTLDTLDMDTTTPEEISNIIGNDSWTRLVCNECNKEVDTIITMGESRDYESNTTDLCINCVTDAYNTINQHKS